MNIFATCDGGLEAALVAELKALGLRGVRQGSRGASFDGGWNEVWTANVCSALANRVILGLAEFSGHSQRALYEGVRAVDWRRWLLPDQTISVDASVAHSAASNSMFVSQVVKDGICDRMRAETGRRPNVNRESPDLPVTLRLVDDQCALGLDTSGLRLHMRGWRTEAGEAPLRETLVAGVLHLTGWQPGEPLQDLLCGSGMFLVEAAQMALGIPPGRLRLTPGMAGFAFERWREHDRGAFERFVANLDARPLNTEFAPFLGTDRDPEVLDLARRNARRARVTDFVRFERTELKHVRPSTLSQEIAGLTVVVNPPYGERLGKDETLGELYEDIGDVLKQRFAGATAWVLTGNADLADRVGLKPARKMMLHNGPIECRLLRYDVYAGSGKAPPPETGRTIV